MQPAPERPLDASAAGAGKMPATRPMQPGPEGRFDPRWTGANLGALVVLCLAGAAALAHLAAAGRWELGEVPAVDARRVEAARQRVNPNTASAASLRRLPELGPVRAAAILDYRQTHGAAALRGLQDLQGVRGIGPATAEALREYLEFAPGGG